jgi:intracellular sulfur oxidation DsrE/DsrF family protein
MSMKLAYRTLACCAIALGSTLLAAAPPLSGTDPSAAVADTGPATLWVYPVIKGYGGVHPRPDLPAGTTVGTDYKVIADVAQGDNDHTRVSGSLVRLARLVNLMEYAEVPRAHVHIAAVIEGEAGYAAFSNASYRERFHVDNPNLPLLRELRQAGVELMVCSQAMAENGLVDSDISPDVQITLSALTDFAVYGARGYSYLQL